MVLYSFINEITQEIRDVSFGMNDVKEYFGEPGEENIKWRRLYIVPQMAMDTKVDPFSGENFVRKTATTKTYGELWDRSAEMSHLRSEKLGAPDPMRTKAEKEFYSKKKA